MGFVKLAMNVAMQNGGDSLDTIANRRQIIVLTIKVNEMHYFSTSSNSSKYCLIVAGRRLSSLRIVGSERVTVD